MLGDMISEERGQMTGIRVLPSTDGRPRVEASFQAEGTIFGVHATDMGTYVSQLRPDGTLFGEGQGVLMTADGDAVSWRGQGIGRFTGRGGATSWRGVIFYETASQTLARLNGIAGVFEFEVDEGDKVEAKDWQWK
jgi:hypothetical protein